MNQLLEEWKNLDDENQPALETLIIQKSTDNHLLTPFVTLQGNSYLGIPATEKL